MRRSISTVVALILMCAGAGTACSQGGVPADVTLPDASSGPQPSGEAATLAETVHTRRSVRSFADRALTASEIGRLLWAAVGLNVDGVSGPTRTAASAGGLYPIEAYLVAGRTEGINVGVYRYDPRDHALRGLSAAGDGHGDLRRELQRAALGQVAVGSAPALIVLAADFSVTARRYGERGSERYVYMDAGHAGQNVILQAEALGLGSVAIGAFEDDAVRRVLGIEHEPLYLIPVGAPAE